MTRVGDYGTEILITVTDPAGTALDVSGATAKTLHLEKPNGTTLTKDLAFVTDGTDGQLTCDLLDGDVDQAGLWYLQVELPTPAGHWRSQPTPVPVERAL